MEYIMFNGILVFGIAVCSYAPVKLVFHIIPLKFVKLCLFYMHFQKLDIGNGTWTWRRPDGQTLIHQQRGTFFFLSTTHTI